MTWKIKSIKKCLYCGPTDRENFSFGWDIICKNCKKLPIEARRETHSINRRRSVYKLNETQYQAMLRDQNGKCAICFEDMEKVHVDHNHETKKVRGLLCRDCNVALGIFKDSSRLLRNAAAYLDKELLEEISKDTGFR